MKSGQNSKELYQRLRTLPWAQLWVDKVRWFDRATSRERFDGVAVIRAVGVVFAESGPAAQKEEVRQWLRALLHDPEEKVRRYALAALPKIGADAVEEAEILDLLRKTTSVREEKFVGQTLDKIGGAATLETLKATDTLSSTTVQRVKASVAREQSPSVIRLDCVLTGFSRLRIHLRGRKGLESIVREEVEAQGKFRIIEVKAGLVAVTALAPFTLNDLFALRCFGTLGIVLGLVKPAPEPETMEALAAAIAAPQTLRLLTALTEGALRYRLDFIGKGHQRAAVRRIADRAFALCPSILNDAREAPWAIDIHPTAHGDSVELRPRLSPDPRYAWRLDDVPAASHPPLAACMARLAGRRENEIVWDPFCGSGLELIERALLGDVSRVHGTDRDPIAIGIAARNFAAALPGSTVARFTGCDFREFATTADIAPGSLTLVISNPPLGRRVRIPHLRGLFDDLFATVAQLLAPGGRFVFTNPFSMESPQRSLQLHSRQVVDLGGFDCRVELYRKKAR